MVKQLDNHGYVLSETWVVVVAMVTRNDCCNVEQHCYRGQSQKYKPYYIRVLDRSHGPALFALQKGW